jgi:hypothetical protein
MLLLAMGIALAVQQYLLSSPPSFKEGTGVVSPYEQRLISISAQPEVSRLP